jgi:hypothetical protein
MEQQEIKRSSQLTQAVPQGPCVLTCCCCNERGIVCTLWRGLPRAVRQYEVSRLYPVVCFVYTTPWTFWKEYGPLITKQVFLFPLLHMIRKWGFEGVSLSLCTCTTPGRYRGKWVLIGVPPILNLVCKCEWVVSFTIRVIDLVSKQRF